MTIDDNAGTNPTHCSEDESSERRELPRGTSLGRYVIIEPIGSGGMGSIYRAYDPELNRGVALKILSVQQTDEVAAERAKNRLIREAQALAQLSHPNVVAVYDVGSFGDDVFIAMELVEGDTLREWMEFEKKSVEEILRVMVAAGRGLSAAHKAGLIHRDFKPANVIVGDDERVRVLDFGLARAIDQEGMPEEGPKQPAAMGEAVAEQSTELENSWDKKEISSSSHSNLLLSPLTQAGGILGTPLYMSPEQHLGQEADERTDQFSFCLVLYEALYGRRPFAGTTLKQLKQNTVKHRIKPPPANTPVPNWLWRIIQKGLCAKPQDRFPNIDSLLADLEKDPEQARRQQQQIRRRRLLVAGLIVVLTVLPIGVWYSVRYRTVQLCKESTNEFVGIWDKATQASVQKAFLSTKKSYARGVWERVETTIGKYLAEWTHNQNEACEARFLRTTLSEELFGLQMGCLQKRKRDLKALITIFAQADTRIVEKAVQASRSLDNVSMCADEEALRSPVPPPTTPEAKARVAAIRDKLTKVIALNRTGKYQRGLELVTKLEKVARAVDYQPVLAEVLFSLGELLEKVGQYKRAEQILYDAARAAGESKDGLLLAGVMAWLARVVGYQQARHEVGFSLGQTAQAVLRLGGGDDVQQSRLLYNMGGLAISSGDNDKALTYFRNALTMRKKVLGRDHPDVAQSLNAIGLVLSSQGEYDLALENLRQSLVIRQKTLGPQHPLVAYPMNNMGLVYQRQAKYDKAHKTLHQALVIWETALGPEHPLLAGTLNELGNASSAQGEHHQALAYQKRSLAIREKALGPAHPLLAWPLSGIGKAQADLERPQLAVEPLERVLRICKKKACPPEPYATGLVALARVWVEVGKDDEQAINLALQARKAFAQAPKVFQRKIQEVDDWLETQRRKKTVAKRKQ